MLRKVAFFIFMFLMISGMALIPAERAFAGFAVSPFNGDFETGDFSGWSTDGDAGIDGEANVIAGNYSAYITNDPYYAVGSCSFLTSDNVYPEFVPKTVNVSFKVRYKTDETTGNGTPWDPFHAVVWTGNGAVNTVTISSSGINAAGGFKVKNMVSNLFLPAPPTVPPFIPGVYYDEETPTLLVSGTIPINTCDPVYITFDVCQNYDLDVNSAAWLDDVLISFENASSTFGNTLRGVTGPPIPCPPLDLAAGKKRR